MKKTVGISKQLKLDSPWSVNQRPEAWLLVKQQSNLLQKQIGLSIIELMIAMLIGLFLLTGMIEIVTYAKQSFRSAVNLSRLQEAGRTATHLIAGEIKRAGYMGGNTQTEKIAGTRKPITPATLSCANGNDTWGRMISLPLVGLNDTSAAYNCIVNNSNMAGGYLQGDVLTVRYATPSPILGPLEPNRLYLRNSLLDGAIFIGQDAGQTANEILDPLASVRELITYNYFVGNSGRSCGNDPIPSLFRTRLDSNGLPSAAEEILPGVEHLQVQYSNGSRYADAHEITEWDQIISAKIWLLVRSECRENQFTDRQRYDMGDISYQPNTNFRRQLYSRVVKLNMKS
jgi:type IV pilus assembly protein PilW